MNSIKLQTDYLSAHNVQDLVKHCHFSNVHHIDATKIIPNKQKENRAILMGQSTRSLSTKWGWITSN